MLDNKEDDALDGVALLFEQGEEDKEKSETVSPVHPPTTPATPATALSTTFSDVLPQVEGELLKKTKNGTWHTRYFALQGKELSWRASRGAQEFKSVQLSSNGECAVRDIQVGIKKFMFEVTLPGGAPILLSASGATEKKVWLTQLQLVCSPAPAVVAPASKKSAGGGKPVLWQQGEGLVSTPAANERLAARLAAFNSNGKAGTSSANAAAAAAVSNPKCATCGEQVFKLEQVKDVLGPDTVTHRRCFTCTRCKRGLTPSTFALSGGKLYCLVHAEQQEQQKQEKQRREEERKVKAEAAAAAAAEAAAVKAAAAATTAEAVNAPMEKPVEEPDASKDTPIAQQQPEPVAVATTPVAPEVETKKEESGAFSAMRRMSASLTGARRASVVTGAEQSSKGNAPLASSSILRRLSGASPSKPPADLSSTPTTPAPPAAAGPSVKGLGMSLKLNLGRMPGSAAMPPLPSIPSNAAAAAAPDRLDNTALMSKPTVPSGRRRKPSMMPGTLLHQPAMEVDRMTSDCTFKAKFEDGMIICMHASSTLERDAWVAALGNVIQLLELKRLLAQAQLVDMMSAVQCQLNIEQFTAKTRDQLAYSGFLEKLSVKSQRNWKRRWFDLTEDGEFKYSGDDKSKKPKHVFQLTSNTAILTAGNEVLVGS